MTEASLTHAKELKQVYLLVFDSYAINVGDVVDATGGKINQRFARELVGTLQNANLLSIEEVDGEDAYQVSNPGTYDNHTRDEAIKVIDAWIKENGMTTSTDTKAKKASTPKAPKEKTYHPCYCGCKENVPSTSFYRPGHDARHAGVIGRLVADDGDTSHYNDLPSEKLVAKSKVITEKALQREAKKSAPKTVDGTITVGKTERVARQSKNGTEYLDAKGNWKSATVTAAKTFVAEAN